MLFLYIYVSYTYKCSFISMYLVIILSLTRKKISGGTSEYLPQGVIMLCPCNSIIRKQREFILFWNRHYGRFVISTVCAMVVISSAYSNQRVNCCNPMSSYPLQFWKPLSIFKEIWNNRKPGPMWLGSAVSAHFRTMEWSRFGKCCCCCLCVVTFVYVFYFVNMCILWSCYRISIDSMCGCVMLWLLLLIRWQENSR